MAVLLLDTHIFVWTVNGDPRLRLTIRTLIGDPANQVFVSAATVWEIAIKNTLGRQTDLSLQDTAANIADALGFTELPVKFAHAEQAALLPPIHNDPFDRMLVAQAMVENLTLVTADSAILRYNVTMLDAS